MRERDAYIPISEDALHELYNTHHECCPEKLLMVGMLGRGVMDLQSNDVDGKARRSAIKWFESPEKDYILSFHQVKLHIDIPQKLLAHIKTVLSLANKAEKERRDAAEQPKRKKGRKKSCELDEGEGDYFCPEIATVLWKQ